MDWWVEIVVGMILLVRGHSQTMWTILRKLSPISLCELFGNPPSTYLVSPQSLWMALDENTNLKLSNLNKSARCEITFYLKLLKNNTAYITYVYYYVLWIRILSSSMLNSVLCQQYINLIFGCKLIKKYFHIFCIFYSFAWTSCCGRH